MSRGLGAAAVILFVLGCAAPVAGSLVIVADGRPAMGTILEIHLVGREGEVSRADLDPLFAEAARLETLFTRWNDESALMRLNAAAGRGPQPVSSELARILADSIAWTRLTRGSFDVTVGPLVVLWSEAGRLGRLPSGAELAAARGAVGAERLRLHGDGRVELVPGMALDLDGVAKGWALDRLAEGLRAAGTPGALLDFGGSSIVAIGRPPDGPRWRTLLRAPEGDFAGTLALADRALSVSGSLGKWSRIEGRRYGHVLDPRSGEPMTRAFLAAVVAPSAGEAEAWSKALLVLGPEEGIALLADREGAEGLLVDESGRRFETPGFSLAAGFEPLPGAATGLHTATSALRPEASRGPQRLPHPGTELADPAPRR